MAVRVSTVVGVVRLALVGGGLVVGGVGLRGLLDDDGSAAPADSAVRATTSSLPSSTAPSVVPSTRGRDQTATTQCSNAAAGFILRYPSAWHTEARDESETCRFFHPEPFSMGPDVEVAPVAIVIERLEVSFDEWVATYDDPGVRVAAREDLVGAGGARAVRIVFSFADDPSGEVNDTYLVDTGAAVLAFSATSDRSPDFDRTQEVLAAMVQSLELFG